LKTNDKKRIHFTVSLLHISLPDVLCCANSLAKGGAFFADDCGSWVDEQPLLHRSGYGIAVR
jgi:hypothetical protein